jgi:hypothetical protein
MKKRVKLLKMNYNFLSDIENLHAQKKSSNFYRCLSPSPLRSGNENILNYDDKNYLKENYSNILIGNKKDNFNNYINYNNTYRNNKNNNDNCIIINNLDENNKKLNEQRNFYFNNNQQSANNNNINYINNNIINSVNQNQIIEYCQNNIIIPEIMNINELYKKNEPYNIYFQ